MKAKTRYTWDAAEVNDKAQDDEKDYEDDLEEGEPKFDLAR